MALLQDHCGQFADRYIELDSVMILIDMILHKPRVYRHLLFNRINYQDMGYNVRKPQQALWKNDFHLEQVVLMEFFG